MSELELSYMISIVGYFVIMTIIFIYGSRK